MKRKMTKRKYKKSKTIKHKKYKGGTNNSVTVVSAYYPMKSKRSKEEYLNRIKKFWSHVPCNLVFFTNKENISFIEEVRKNYKDKTKVISLELEDFEALKKYPRSFWEKQYEIDGEKYHSPELYMVWFEKKEFVLKVIKSNPFNSDYFVWCDAGIGSPDAEINTESDVINKFNNFPIVSKIPNDKFLLLKFRDISKNSIDTNFKDVGDTTGAGILAASKDVWEKFSKMYDEMLEYYLKTNRFVGKEQNIYTSMIIKDPNLFHTIDRNHYNYYTLLYYLTE